MEAAAPARGGGDGDSASGSSGGRGRRRRGGKRKRSAGVEREEIGEGGEDERPPAEETGGSKKRKQEQGEKKQGQEKEQWGCPACTFLNEAARRFCEMCATPNPTAATGAEAREWSCPSCTLMNPPRERLCGVCGSLNPEPAAGVLSMLRRRSPFGGDSESSDGDDSGDGGDGDQGGGWECATCDDGELLPLSDKTCPSCSAQQPRAALLARTRAKAEHKRKRRKKTREGEPKAAYGVSSSALRKLLKTAQHTGKLTDALQSLTHTLAMIDASAESEWGGIGGGALFMRGSSSIFVRPSQKDPELLLVLLQVFQQEGQQYPRATKLLAIQSINYLVKIERDFMARTAMTNVTRMYIAALKRWPTESKELGGQSAARDAQMIIEECVNGLSSMCNSEPSTVRELSTTAQFKGYLQFLEVLLSNENSSSGNVHASVQMTALEILQRCCVKMQWERSESSRRKSGLHSAATTEKNAHSITLEIAQELISVLRKAFVHKHKQLHTKAAKCLLLVFSRAPHTKPSIIQRLVPAELVREFVRVVVDSTTDEPDESRLAVTSLLISLFDTRQNLVSLFLRDRIYEPFFEGLPTLLASSSSPLSKRALKLSNLLTRAICQRNTTKPPVDEARRRHRSNSLPDPNVLITVLLDFIEANSIPAVSAVLKDGAELNFPDIFDVDGHEIEKPLHVAVEHSAMGMVRFLVKRGADIHLNGPQGTALHIAARKGRCDLVVFLLKCGAKMDATDRDGKTVTEVVNELEGSGLTVPVKKILDVYKKMHTHDDNDEDSETDAFPGRSWRVSSRSGFNFNDDEDDEDDEDDDDDDDDDDELDDLDEDEEDDEIFYDGYDDDEGEIYDHDRVDDNNINGDDEYHSEEGSSDDNSDQDRGQGRNIGQRELAVEGDNASGRAKSVSRESENSIATPDQADAYTVSILHCLLTVLHGVDLQNVDRSVLSSLANVLEMSSSRPIRELKDEDIVRLLDTVHYLLQTETNVTAKANAKATASAAATSSSDSLSAKEKAELASHILALRIILAITRKSDTSSTIFYQIERRGIGEQIELLNQVNSRLIGALIDVKKDRHMRDTIFTRGAILLRSLRAEMIESGMLHLHRLKNLARRLKSITADASQQEKETAVVDFVELFEHANLITPYEFKQSMLLPAILHYLTPADGLNEERIQSLMHALNSVPGALNNFIARLQTIINQEEAFPILSFCSTKGGELYPLTRPLKLNFKRAKPLESENAGARRSACVIQTSPLTHFQSLERSIFRAMPPHDSKLTKFYQSLVGYKVQKIVENKWQKFLVVGYDSFRSYHLLKSDSSTSTKDFVEMVLHDTQCRLLGPVEVYESSSLELELFGTPAGGPSNATSKNSKKRKKISKKKRKQMPVDEEEAGILVEVKNSTFPRLGPLKDAWYSGVLESPPSDMSKPFDEVVTAGNFYSVVMTGSDKTIRKVSADRIRPRSKKPQVGSVMEVDGELGEVTRVYEDESSANMPLWDVKMNSEVEKVRVAKHRTRFPASKRIGDGDNHIEAMSIRRLFPGKESSATVGRVGDRVWVLPLPSATVKNISVAGVVKRFPSGLESIRESNTVVVEVSFSDGQTPVALKVDQDRILNFALSGLSGGNHSRLLAALQGHGHGGGTVISDSNRGVTLREAFERLTGSGRSQTFNAGDSRFAASRLQNMISDQSSRRSMTSNTDSDLTTSTSNTTAEADSAATSRANSPTDASSKRAAKGYRDDDILRLMSHDGCSAPWKCTSFPRVKMLVGLRRCRGVNSSYRISEVINPPAVTDNQGETKTELPRAVSQLLEIDSASQEWVVKPHIRSICVDLFNQFNPASSASSVTSRQKKKKVHQPQESLATVKQSDPWDVEKFISLMQVIFERAGSHKNSAIVKYCVLFSKFATLESNRTLLCSDGFVSAMANISSDEVKAMQILNYLRSRGYSKKISHPLADSNETIHLGKGDGDSSSLATDEIWSEKKKMVVPVLQNFLPDDNLLKCLEILREARGSGYRDIIAIGDTGAIIPPWKMEFELLCDFVVEWVSPVRSTSGPNLPAGRPDIDNYAERNDFSWLQDLSDYSVISTGKMKQASMPESVTESIRLLRYLFEIRPARNIEVVDESIWTNPRLYNKLETQLQDVLTLCSGIYPKWCDEMIANCKFFFPRRLRENLFRATSFGCTRSLHWFRAQLALDENGGDLGGSAARDFGGVYNQDISISPIPKDRVKVHRANILSSAEAVMKMHAKRKALLDVVFVGEKGYGSGVTAAFYSASAHALQSVNENRQIATRCWVPGEETYESEGGSVESADLELDSETAPVIRHANGLFPYPHDKAPSKVIDRFRMMGRLAGKALMDERLLPLPLSKQFMQLVVGETVLVESVPEVFGSHGRIIYSLFQASRKLKTRAGSSVDIDGMNVAVWLEAVDLSFIEPFSQEPLMPGGSSKSVTVSTISEYVSLVLERWLHSGVAAQVTAFREGISEVLPLKKLSLLFVPELLEMLCGDNDVKWDSDSLLRAMRLAHGYTRDSQPIQFFARALDRMSSAERRAFLLYATGCPNLPPGGIAALKPQFEVVRRVVDSGVDVDRALPFARTCTNTLHLPAYSSQQVMDTQLAFAVANSRGVIDRD